MQLAFPLVDVGAGHHREMAADDRDRLDLPVLTRRDVAERLELSLRTVDRLVATGGIAHHRIGDLVRFTKRDLADFVKRSRVSPK